MDLLKIRIYTSDYKGNFSMFKKYFVGRYFLYIGRFEQNQSVWLNKDKKKM